MLLIMRYNGTNSKFTQNKMLLGRNEKITCRNNNVRPIYSQFRVYSQAKAECIKMQNA